MPRAPPSSSSRPSTANRPPSRQRSGGGGAESMPTTAPPPRRAPSHGSRAAPPAHAPRAAPPAHVPRTPQDAYAVRSRSISDRSVSDMSRDTVSTKSSLAFSRASSASTASEPRSPHDSYAAAKPSRAGMPPPPRPPQPYATAAAAAASPVDLSTHPFGQELAQVTELAEEFGVRDRLDLIDEEERDMARKGLCKLSAETYLAEVDDLLAYYLSERHGPGPRQQRAVVPETVWI